MPPETALLFPPFPSPGELEPGITIVQPPPVTQTVPGITEEPGAQSPGGDTEGRVLRDFESETPVTILGE
ncbi:hypothetical protein KJ039_08175 [bacterium]|nr:hypothetical protein [bacterium]